MSTGCFANFTKSLLPEIWLRSTKLKIRKIRCWPWLCSFILKRRSFIFLTLLLPKENKKEPLQFCSMNYFSNGPDRTAFLILNHHRFLKLPAFMEVSEQRKSPL